MRDHACAHRSIGRSANELKGSRRKRRKQAHECGHTHTHTHTRIRRRMPAKRAHGKHLNIKTIEPCVHDLHRHLSRNSRDRYTIFIQPNIYAHARSHTHTYEDRAQAFQRGRKRGGREKPDDRTPAHTRRGYCATTCTHARTHAARAVSSGINYTHLSFSSKR